MAATTGWSNSSLTWKYRPTSTSTDSWVAYDSCSSSIPFPKDYQGWIQVIEKQAECRNLRRGETYDLPDGSVLKIDSHGNYQIDDSAAKVVYRAHRNREFSPHVNASDMLGSFVDYLRQIGVPRQDVLNLPIHLFVSWLVIEAAERDGDEIPIDIPRIEHSPVVKALKRPKCLSCGRFIKRSHQAARFPFCSPQHGVAYLETCN